MIKSEKMKIKNSVYALNTLIEINNDRIKSYETASKETEESNLKDMFSEFQQSSQKHKAELVKEVQKLGGIPHNEIKIHNAFSRIIMKLKAFLINKDRDEIMDTCEYDDFVAIQNYGQVINGNMEDMSGELQKLLIVQQAYIKADHDKIKYLNDVMIGYK